MNHKYFPMVYMYMMSYLLNLLMLHLYIMYKPFFHLIVMQVLLDQLLTMIELLYYRFL